LDLVKDSPDGPAVISWLLLRTSYSSEHYISLRK
jgi:hypothetical protein